MISSASNLGDVNAVKYELAGEVLRSSGTLRMRAIGRSMLPTVWPGDMLVFEPVRSNDVSEGDIVLFSNGRQFVAHRVVTKSNAPGGARVQTQGDAVARADSPVSASDLLGKVAFILRNGKSVEPGRSLRFSERAVAALVRRSEIVARVVVGAHGMRKSSHGRLQVYASRVQTSEDRAVPCQS